MAKRVVVGLSGGIDSAVSAYLLKKRGYEVIGVHLVMSVPDHRAHNSGLTKYRGPHIAIQRAANVAERLGIDYFEADCCSVFKKNVVEPFCRAYLKGKTPNPCVWCNARVKFPMLFYAMQKCEAQHIATGHYARIDRAKGRCLIKRAKDAGKDQSYFLYMLEEKLRKHLIFPLGVWRKSSVRELAKKRGLTLTGQDESRDICFIRGDYRSFVRNAVDSLRGFPESGDIVDMRGKVVGRHNGIHHYTVGQRKGVGSFGSPVYVIAVDKAANRITVGKRRQLSRRHLSAENLVWHAAIKRKQTSGKPLDVHVKIRSAQPLRRAWVRLNEQSDSANVFFRRPVEAVTPGQSVVFYRNSQVLGGGLIDD